MLPLNSKETIKTLPMKVLVIGVLCFLAAVACAAPTSDRSPGQFRCVLCEEFVFDALIAKSLPAGNACKKTLDGCSFLLPSMEKLQRHLKAQEAASATPRDLAFRTCIASGMCVGNPTVNRILPEANTLPDIKVSMAYGGRNSYNTVRLTVIDSVNASRSQGFRDFFSYGAPFEYRWKEFQLYTTLVNVTPGVATTIDVGGEFNYSVMVPSAKGSAVRGVFVADPCYSSRYMICIFGSVLHVEERLQALFSALGDNNNVDFYGVLGDNFYDRDGTLAPPFFNSLSDSIKSKLLVTVPGNHDFWMMGDPWLAQPATDPNGNGFMQYYGQDVLSSTKTFPFNFSVDPDKEGIWNHYDRLPSFENFFFYYHIGPVGMIGFSGAHFLSDLTPKLEEACQYMQEHDVSWVLLLGHWNSAGSGAVLNMTTNYLYHSTLLQLPGCRELGTRRIKYLLGHTHCNVIDDVDRGFMIGGFGMGGGKQDCGDFGVPYIEATEQQLLITYFPITHRFNWWDDQYDAVMACIKAGGLSTCRSLGRIWLNATI